MARQKPTERSEARRRYRSELSTKEAEAAEAAAAEALGAPAAPTGRGKAKAAPAEPAPGTRLGIVEAFRLASRPADIRGDIAALPAMARSRTIVVPVGLTIAGAALLVVVGPAKHWLADAVIGISISPQPTMIPAFLAGMLARRGSWLSGLVVGLFGVVVFDILCLTVLAEQIGDVDRSIFLGYLVLGPLFGGAVGAFAGFYRRFLAYSSPPRERRPAKRAKPARRR